MSKPKIRRQYVSSSRMTYGARNTRRYITIHETANTNKGANAAAHANLQSRGNVRNASWHFQVDDTEIVQSYLTKYQCWHAGDGRGRGNLESIAIEICVNSDGNYDKALANAADLVRYLRKKFKIPAENVVQHNHWSGKNCPTKLRERGKQGWDEFVASTDPKPKKQEPKPAPKPKPESKPKKKTVAQMAQEIIDGKHGNGHENRRKSLGITKAEYEKVRAEVNRRLK